MTDPAKRSATMGWKLTLSATDIRDGTQAALRPWIAAIPDENEARSKLAKVAPINGAVLEPFTADEIVSSGVPPGEIRKA
jgi:hypothetical protein